MNCKLANFISGQEAEQERAYDDYPPQQPYAPLSPPPAGPPPAGYPQTQENYYPSSNSFPPPPNAGYSPAPGFNPTEYPAQPAAQQPGAQIHPDYGYPPQTGYTPPTGGPYTPPVADPYLPAGNRARRGDENVSAAPFVNNTTPGAPLVSEQRVEEGG